MPQGVLISFDPERNVGRIRGAEGDVITFVGSEFRGQVTAESCPFPVEFVASPHPHDPRRSVARDVRPLEGLTEVYGRLNVLKKASGFIRLQDNRNAYFSLDCTRLENPQIGDEVLCRVVPGQGGQLFALSVVPASGVPEVPPVTRSLDGCVAAISQRGRRQGKSHNDDGFLVAPLAGDMVLLAIADGVSDPPNGWWASDKCLEILWKTRGEFAEHFLRAFTLEDNRAVMHAWITAAHRDFLSQRGSQLGDYQPATSTLTFVVVRERRVFIAASGDTPVYTPDRNKGKIVTLTKGLLDDARDSRLGLRQHMGVDKHRWRPRIDDATLAPGALLVLCSDGVSAGDQNRTKRDRLYAGLVDEKRPLQKRVEDVVHQIADLGEPDDLTLVVYNPE